MRILGIDPGTSLIGYGIVDVTGKDYQAVNYGDFRTPAKQSTAERAKAIFTFFDKLIKQHRPDKISIEKLFFFKNSKTIMAVSEIRGLLIWLAVSNGIPVSEFTPLQVKQSVSGYGRAEKRQIQEMVKLILNLEQVPKPDDVADALALAICCANTIKY